MMMQGDGPDNHPEGHGDDSRKLGTRDIMVMTATTAAGLAWTRAYVLDYLLPFVTKKGALPQRYQLVWILATVPMLTTWSVGLFLRQALRHRSTPSRWARRPGTVACGVVALTAAVELLLASGVRAVSLTIPGWRGTYGLVQPNPVSYVIAWNMPDAGVAVAGAWLLMASAGSFRPESTFEDRAGRGFGWAWMTMFLIRNAYFLSMMM